MVIFPSASKEPRPVRLKETTRLWAWESLHGKYGDDTVKNMSVSLDDIENFNELSDTQKYDLAVRRIAETAPIRICGHEALCGAATLGSAIYHIVPATRHENGIFSSVSHLTIRYDKVIKEGLSSYERDIALRLEDKALSGSQREFLCSLQNVIESIRIWHGRYLDAVKESRPDLYEPLLQVPFSPARNFREALQSLWFIFAFVRLCGNWPGIGRLDLILGDYLENDLKSDKICVDDARELLASFFIKGCEWILSGPVTGSGDAQHYQNIVLAGVDENGREITNTVTYLTLDVVEELGISDYPITVRLNENSPKALKEKTAKVMRHGGGIVAIYNEALILKSLESLDYPAEEARSFANDGCWEVQIPGKTDFGYMPFDALDIFSRAIGVYSDDIPGFENIEDVYSAFREELRQKIHSLYNETVLQRYAFCDGAWQSAGNVIPTSVISLFEDDCIKNARSYYNCGTRYTVRSPHIGGAPDVSNSLYAIEKIVFKEKRISFKRLVEALKNNWENDEMLRLYIKNSCAFYGNDSDEVDFWHARMLNDFADEVIKCGELSSCPVKFIPGVSTFGRQIDWAPNRSATAFGYKKGDILSGNDSPCPGTDACGATAIIKSYCKTDLVKQSSGAALDIKMFPESLSGEKGITALTALMDSFLQLGGFFMQLDAMDTETLKAAQKDPAKYKTLSVRVSGWNARFVTLNEEWQRMIIERSSQNFN